MANSTKPLSERDAGQVLQAAFNDNEKSISVTSFASSKVGATITRTVVSGTVDDYRYLDVVFTQTGDTSSGSPVVVGLSNVLNGDLQVGQYVLGSNIPANTVILSLDSESQITLSGNASSSTSTSLQFANLLYLLEITYDNSNHDNVNMTQRLQ